MITARGLVQTFQTRVGKEKKEVRAVDGVNLDVAEGEVVGFLGPNGAGKTTTLETCEGYRDPHQGTVRVLGLDTRRERRALVPRIGVMLEAGGAW